MSTFKLLSDENCKIYRLFKGENHLCNLIKIPEGKFLREDGCDVKVSSFYMGEFPVTQELYEAVTGKNPSRFKGEDRPVETVSWYDAVEFCDLLTREVNLNPRFYTIDKTRKDENNRNKDDELQWIVNFNKGSKGFRLPTEAEWEYAAKGHKESVTSGSYPGSKFLDVVGWYRENDGYETKTIGLKFPNAFGLFDIGGNVWEWCYDWYGNHDKMDLENPIGPKSGTSRVDRGGGWYDSAVSCRSGGRYGWAADNRDDFLGFRLVFVP